MLSTSQISKLFTSAELEPYKIFRTRSCNCQFNSVQIACSIEYTLLQLWQGASHCSQVRSLPVSMSRK